MDPKTILVIYHASILPWPWWTVRYVNSCHGTVSAESEQVPTILNLVGRQSSVGAFCRQSGSGHSRNSKATGSREARHAKQRTNRAARAGVPPSALAAHNIEAAEAELLAICKSQKLLAQADAALQPFVLDYLNYALYSMEIAMTTAALPAIHPAWGKTARVCLWNAVWSHAPSMQLQYRHLIQPLAAFFGYAHYAHCFRLVKTSTFGCYLQKVNQG